MSDLSQLGDRTCRTLLTALILAAVGGMVALLLTWRPLPWLALTGFLILTLVAVGSASLLIALSDLRHPKGELIERQLAAGKALYGAVLRFLDGATYDGVNDPDRPSDWTKGEFTREGTADLMLAMVRHRAAEEGVELLERRWDIRLPT